MLAAHRFMQPDTATPTTPVHAVGTGNTSNGFGGRHSVTTAAAFTPTANALIIVPAAIYDGFGPRTRAAITVTDTLGGLTWHEVATPWFDDANFNGYKTAIYWAIAPSSPTSGTITLTSASASFVWFTISNVAQIASGYTAASPIAQSANALVQAVTGDGTTTHSITATLGSAPTGLVLATLHQNYTSNGLGTQPATDPDFTHLDYLVGFGAVEIDIDVSHAPAQQGVTWAGLVEAAVGASWWYYGLLVEIH